MLVFESEAIGLFQKFNFGNKPVNIKTNKPPWVAEIIDFGDLNPFLFKRKFLIPNKDYTIANKVGSRGIFYYFHLYENKVYDIFRYVSWKNTERFFAKIKNNKIIKLSKDEVILWISNT